MLAEARLEHELLSVACRHVGGLRGVSPETLRVWQRRYGIDTGAKPGTSLDMAEENRRLRREVTELRKANEFLCRILRAAVRGFLTSCGVSGREGSVGLSQATCAMNFLVPEIQQLHAKHHEVYGRGKMHALLKRDGWDIGRDQTERLLRLAGVPGVGKAKRVFTTRPGKAAVLPAGLVNQRLVT